MIGHYLRSLEGIQTIGLVFLVLCLGAFLYVIYRTIRTDKNYLRKMEQLPLEADDPSPSSMEKVHP